MHNLRFGTAGIPLSASGQNTMGGIAEVHRLGLEAMELEFVHSVNISPEGAKKVKAAKEENEIELTCHAPYYINLAAIEKEKLEASIGRLVKAARIACLCGARSVAVHPGFYLARDKSKVYLEIKNSLMQALETLRQEGVKITISPETMGKPTQFGSLEEILKLSSELDGIMPCLDFAHLHAREGKINSKKEFCSVLEQVEKKLGSRAIKDLHIQVSGINYTEKGEKSHAAFNDSDFDLPGFLSALKQFDAAGIVICESPAMEKDALLLKNEFEAL